MANHSTLTKRASAELAAARKALQHCALLFTLIEGQLAIGTDVENAIHLAQIGNEKASYSGERAESESEYFEEVKHG
ncbi:MAG: hypothetical protein M3O74_06840 [Pseudomonadota bacterium]|nr:hypothetical protein [Pseudomonadota bacterium]